MSRDKPSDTGTKQGEPDYSKWLTRAQVVRRTGLKLQGVRSRQRAGEFICELRERDGKTIWLFEPDQFDDAEFDNDEEFSAAALLKEVSAAMKAAQDYADQASRRLLEQAGLNHEMAKSMNAMLSELVSKQQAQLSELHERTFKMRDQFEQSLSQAQDRELKAEHEKLKEKRVDKLVDVALPYVSPILAEFSSYLGGKRETPPSLGAKSTNGASGTANGKTASKTEESAPWWHQDPHRLLVLSVTPEQAQRAMATGAVDGEKAQALLVLRRDWDACNGDDHNVLLLAQRTTEILSGLDGPKRALLREVMTPTQHEYLDVIDRIAKEAAEEEAHA